MALFLIFRMELDKQIYEAARLMAKGRLKKAEPILRSCLKNNPLDVNAMKLLADVGVEFRAYKEAGFLLSRALDLEPDYHEARFSYANLLYKRQLPLESLEELDIFLSKLDLKCDNIFSIQIQVENHFLGKIIKIL